MPHNSELRVLTRLHKFTSAHMHNICGHTGMNVSLSHVGHACAMCGGKSIHPWSIIPSLIARTVRMVLGVGLGQFFICKFGITNLICKDMVTVLVSDLSTCEPAPSSKARARLTRSHLQVKLRLLPLASTSGPRVKQNLKLVMT